MLTDPKKVVYAALPVALAGCLWFLALAIDPDALYARFGFDMHAITFLSIFLVIAALIVAGFFARMATVRRELLEGRRVLGTWSIDAATLAAAAPGALAEENADKRQALLLIWGFLAVIFGGFALYDPEAAPAMIAIALVVAALTGLAHLLGGRVRQDHWRMRDGRVIVGERGLLFNGVLHVWALPLTRLDGVTTARDPDRMIVRYSWLARTGRQSAAVTLPVPSEASATADAVLAGLVGLGLARPRRRPRRKVANGRINRGSDGSASMRSPRRDR